MTSMIRITEEPCRRPEQYADLVRVLLDPRSVVLVAADRYDRWADLAT